MIPATECLLLSRNGVSTPEDSKDTKAKFEKAINEAKALKYSVYLDIGVDLNEISSARGTFSLNDSVRIRNQISSTNIVSGCINIIYSSYRSLPILPPRDRLHRSSELSVKKRKKLSIENR